MYAALALLALAPPVDFRVVPDIVYGEGRTSGGTIPLLLDAYLPAGAKAAPPVGLIHGGGFVHGSRKDPDIVELASRLAREGFAVFTLDYRLEGDRPVSENLTMAQVKELKRQYPEIKVRPAYLASVAVEDAIKARRFVQASYRRFAVLPDRWGVMGSSAGAVTALGTAYLADDLFHDPQRADAVVDLWGAIEPVEAIQGGEPPVLIVHGTEDTTVRYEESTRILERARAVGVPAERITMEGAKHGFKSADLYHRKVAGTNATVFEAIVAFLRRCL